MLAQGAFQREEGDFEGHDGLRLYRQAWIPAQPVTHLVFLHGYSDHSNRYLALFEHLVGRDVAVHAFDLRGHGRSEGRRAHVDAFSEYLKDLDVFLGLVRNRADRWPLFVAGHSMGGLIVARWLLERPQGVEGAALSSPFMELAFEPPKLKVWASLLIGKVVPHLSVANGLEPEKLSTDPEMQQETRDDPLYLHNTTPRWFSEAMAAQDEVRRRASEITTPLLVMQAGGDRITSPEASRDFFDAVTSPDKSWERYEGFEHELFRERERARPMNRLSDWLLERAK